MWNGAFSVSLSLDLDNEEKQVTRARNTYRKRASAEEGLEEQLTFETLLAQLSAQFVNLPSDRIYSDIEETNV